MALKLYHGGYGNFMEFAVADSEENAIKRIGEKLGAPFLPITAEAIDSVDGYPIVPETADSTDEDVVTVFAPAPTENKTDEAIPTPAITRHCKKCDFVCESQAELMRHYATAHPKGG